MELTSQGYIHLWEDIIMNKTKAVTNQTINMENRISVATEELQSLLGCGRKTAVEIGDSAGARVIWGKRVLWNVKKIREYMERIAS